MTTTEEKIALIDKLVQSYFGAENIADMVAGVDYGHTVQIPDCRGIIIEIDNILNGEEYGYWYQQRVDAEVEESLEEAVSDAIKKERERVKDWAVDKRKEISKQITGPGGAVERDPNGYNGYAMKVLRELIDEVTN